MAEAFIPVDLFNPGQVLGSLGFLEAADVLLGDAEGGFKWGDGGAQFVLSASGAKNPFEVVLRFLLEASLVEWKPADYVEGGAADGDDDEEGDCDSDEVASSDDADAEVSESEQSSMSALISGFPSPEGDRNSLPVQLKGPDGRAVIVSHWADGTTRNDFKLYSGNRSAHRIASSMLRGVRSKSDKKTRGEVRSRGLLQLWEEQRDALVRAPFDVVTPMGGSFNFDARGAWTAIDAGYSPNTQKDSVEASPVVEILAAIGLEHARPNEYATGKVRYAVWGLPLPPLLARVALAGADLRIPRRCFEFELRMSGKNKVVTFAREENWK